MVSHLDPTLLERYLVHILTPVYRVIDDDSIRDAHIGAFRLLVTCCVINSASRRPQNAFPRAARPCPSEDRNDDLRGRL